MSHPEKPEHLLGGYATGSLSDAERQRLFEAGLLDQAVFDELMDEQILKERLELPGVKAEIARALEPTPGLWSRFWAQLGKPVSWAAAGSLAGAVFMMLVFWKQAPEPASKTVAQVSVQPAPKAEPVPPTPAVGRESVRETESRVANPERKPEAAAVKAPARSADSLSKSKEQVAQSVAQRVPEPAVQGAVGGMVATAPPAQPSEGESMRKNEAVLDRAQAPKPVAAPAAPPPPAPALSASADASKAVAPPVLAIDYGVLRENEEGVFAPMAGGGVLRPADRFKVTLTPTEDGELVLYRRGPDGAVAFLEQARLRRGVTAMLPSQGAYQDHDLVIEFGRAGARQDSARDEKKSRFRAEPESMTKTVVTGGLAGRGASFRTAVPGSRVQAAPGEQRVAFELHISR